jgi:hypothetical protein
MNLEFGKPFDQRTIGMMKEVHHLLSIGSSRSDRYGAGQICPSSGNVWLFIPAHPSLW